MNDKTIIDIINRFASDGFVFSNEQDFQFEMALALKNEPDVSEVKLETISLNEDWEAIQEKAIKHEKLNKRSKEYYDILVVLKNNQKILIELKYKTPNKICLYETKKGKMVTFAQGAYDEGAYAYINDICRLEKVNNRNLLNGISIDYGYAVLLTNDKNYRINDFSKIRKGKRSPWGNYSIKEGRCLKGKLLFIDINDPDNYATSKNKYPALTINNPGGYSMKWLPYELDEYSMKKNIGKYDDYEDVKNTYHPGFSFLVSKVKP